ncbi:25139_t:CDS:2 [Gigaspora margarita]|uniref:25139_t:CDS:1 n=1 Tax=Gigaspora margarita TaxID=4874 RepID=A0ABN7ULB8_GIGMA|nr:25139_t:CDS:2 [Gigaspora margarita]
MSSVPTPVSITIFNPSFFISSVPSRDIPYANYFTFCPYDRWSLRHYVMSIIDTYTNVEKDIAHTVFYNTLYNIIDDPQISQEVSNVAKRLTSNKNADIKSVQSLWNNTEQSNRASSTLPQSSSSTLEKRKSVELIVSSNKRQRIDHQMSCLCLNIDVPSRTNGSVNILEILKSAIRIFDQNTIALGSIHSYKSSNRLNVHGFEITSQWHLERIHADGDLYHNFCDLTISKPGTSEPVSEQLRPLEVWVVHFSCEDDVTKKPYWPCRELQEKGLNVMHFWHDKGFLNIRMSSKSLDVTGENAWEEDVDTMCADDSNKANDGKSKSSHKKHADYFASGYSATQLWCRRISVGDNVTSRQKQSFDFSVTTGFDSFRIAKKCEQPNIKASTCNPKETINSLQEKLVKTIGKIDILEKLFAKEMRLEKSR